MPGPDGTRLDDGFPSFVTLADDTTLGLWEKEVAPPGFDGGREIDTTSMRNVKLRTKVPPKLIELPAATFKCAYDEGHLDRIRAMVNVNQEVKWTYPSGLVYTHWGFLQRFAPDPLVEGRQATATATIMPTCEDLRRVETGPSFTTYLLGVGGGRLTGVSGGEIIRG